MESLERSKAVVKLGKRLISQLTLGDDELSQWMAHLLAERIHDAENAPSEHRAAAQRACTELVFQLWEHRYSLSNRIHPFKKLESLLRTLDSLDINNGPRFRYFPAPPPGIEIEDDADEMFSLAVKLDDVTRILMQHLLATAAEEASEQVKPWIQSAAAAAADMTLELRIVGFVNDGTDRASEDMRIAREALDDKIQKLESFSSLATAHAADLRAKRDLLSDKPTDVESKDERWNELAK